MDKTYDTDNMSFDELLLLAADSDKTNLALSVVKNAKEGKDGAIKLLQVAMERALYQNEDKLKLTDDQLKRIIVLASQRITL